MGALDRLLDAVVSGLEAGHINSGDAAQALGEVLLSARGALCEERDASWREMLVRAGVPVDVMEAAHASAQRADLAPVAEVSGRQPGEVARLLEHIRDVLGERSTWSPPPTYESSAIAVIDSVWSIGVRYSGVLNVIGRYRGLRAQQGLSAETDTPMDLVEWIEQIGGPPAFAEAVGNRQRTSSRNGILKAEAVLRAASVLVDLGVGRPSDIVEADEAHLDRLRAAWIRIPGQGTGISLDYFLMLSGKPGVKGDRMIRRFVAQALGLPNELSVDAGRAVSLVRQVAETLDVDDRELDFAIWQYESTRATR